MVFLLSGISGSGKSTFYKNNHTDKGIYINPDSIRKEVCGNISDQSQNPKVWKIAYDSLRTACEEGVEEIWFDATTLSSSSVRAVLEIASLHKQNVVLYVMQDSLNKNLCIERIKNDIDNSVDRANVPIDVVNSQFSRFMIMYENMDENLARWRKEFSNIKIFVVYK